MFLALVIKNYAQGVIVTAAAGAIEFAPAAID
jgi:hypothetical protein